MNIKLMHDQDTDGNEDDVVDKDLVMDKYRNGYEITSFPVGL